MTPETVPSTTRVLLSEWGIPVKYLTRSEQIQIIIFLVLTIDIYYYVCILTSIMPRVNIFIRKEDTDKWKAIDNKSEWVHLQLNKSTEAVEDPLLEVTVMSKYELETEAPKSIFKKETWRQCKNGHAIPAFQNKCLGKGCKYA